MVYNYVDFMERRESVMGLFDSLKDFAGSAKNAWNEEQKRIAEKERVGQQAGTLKPGATAAAPAKTPAPAPAASPKPASPVIDAQRGVASLKWGTINPIPYEDYTNAVCIPVKMCGLIEVMITDPGTTITEERFKILFLDRIQPMVAALAKDMVPYDKLQFQQKKLADELKASFAKDNILVTNFIIASVTPREDQKKPLDMSSPEMAAKLNLAQGDASSGKFCTKCGYPNEGTKFCSNCGAVLNK